MAALIYRTTPSPWCNLSLAELPMGKRLRAQLPQIDTVLQHQWSYLPQFRSSHKTIKERQKYSYDSRHGVCEVPAISDETDVWVTTGPNIVQGRVVSKSNAPRSYLMETPSGTVRRNRYHLGVVPDKEHSYEADQEEPPLRKIMTHTQTGTMIKPLSRYRIMQTELKEEGEM